ncbi:MAG: Gfo/Idh/MocA family protein [Phyllobacterium sp.]
MTGEEQGNPVHEALEAPLDKPTGRIVRWGIVGTGQIARQFAADLQRIPEARIVSIYSRSVEKAEQFRSEFDAERAYSDFEAFISDSALDVVYIATPNSQHLPQTLRALRSSKPILTEKPIALSAPEAQVIEREARRHKTFAMEGLWTRFLPAIQAARQKIENGEIGTVKRITSDLSYYHPYDPQSRFFNRPLGGGAALDLGVYPVSLAMHLLGQPEQVSGRWIAAPSGVDMRTEITLHYPGVTAQLSCGFDKDGDNHFLIEGSKGALRIDAPFLKAQRLTLFAPSVMRSPWVGPDIRMSGYIGKILNRLPVPGRRIELYPFDGGGLQFEAKAVTDAILNGERHSPIMPLSESISVLRAIGIVLSRPPVTSFS